ncbi:MAG TPA: hypothetical protein VM143_07280 [Acidimicrobiales bacterium]|nr:hypothetical protein [Acidimicrobiales bacterium]
MRATRMALVRTLLVMGTCGVLVGACASREDPLEIGLRRIALDLAFKDATKAEPVSPRQVAVQLGVADVRTLAEIPEEEEPPRRTPRVIVIPPRRPQPVCEAAPPGANYDVPTYPVVKDPPEIGTYTRINQGSVKIGTAAFDLDFQYPPKSEVDVTDVAFVTATAYLNNDDVDKLGVPAQVRGDPTAFPNRVEYSMTRHGPSGLKVVDRYRYSLGGTTGGDFVWLIRRETTLNGKTSVFNPTPPIRYVKLFVAEGPDSEITHGGTDRATNTALTVQSKIVGRESVDVCGEVVDTFKVQIVENFVDLSKQPPVISGNESGTANFWNVRFDHGLLLVREEVHSTYRGSTEVAGAPVPVTVKTDYIGTIDALKPKPLKTRSTTPTTAPPVDDGGDGEEG